MLSAPALAGRKILRTEMARPPTLRFGATAFAHPCVASEGWWALRDSNPRPTRCKRDALTTAPSARPRRTMRSCEARASGIASVAVAHRDDGFENSGDRDRTGRAALLEESGQPPLGSWAARRGLDGLISSTRASLVIIFYNSRTAVALGHQPNPD